jgi:ABC-type branched-subunit amino acid transport system substrate-binding protein
MMRSTPTWRLLAAVGAASLVLTACGGEEGDTTPGAEEIPKGDGTLVIGTLLPQTGSLAFLGPPEFAGVDLAIKHINAAGGVLGKQVELHHSDSGDTATDIASQSVDTLVSRKVDTIIGAASSGVSLTVIDKITGNGIVHFSPANTSPAFTTYEDKGLYFRTAPSDVLQGRVLGDLVLADGNATAGMLVLQDAYGVGLKDNAKKAIEDGGGEVLEEIVYDPKAAEFSAEVSQIRAANPDAIILIGFEETKKIIPQLVAAGLNNKKWYFVDGNLSNYGKELPAGTLNGQKGTLPGAETTGDFQKELLAEDPDLKDFSYAPESYDAAILTALAAEAAGNDSGAAIASKLVEVSKGGEKCTSFEQCKQLLADGKDIDYDGKSGPIEFSDAGDPTEATIGIYQYGPDNTYKNLEFRTGKI